MRSLRGEPQHIRLEEKVMFVNDRMIAEQFYTAPDDVVRIAKIFTVTRKAFSIALLEARWDSFDYETRMRAAKTIQCLKTKGFFR